MIRNEQPRNNYPDPESFTEQWQFQRANQHTAPKFKIKIDVTVIEAILN